MAEFSDYIVYVDESGDHSLTSIDPQFPVFALSFCVVRKDTYMAQIVPAVQALKFRYWGHDAVILHEHEIRKSKGDFTWLLTDRERRDAFYEDLNQIMVDAPISLIPRCTMQDSLCTLASATARRRLCAGGLRIVRQAWRIGAYASFTGLWWSGFDLEVRA